jgi:hypothetical protein
VFQVDFFTTEQWNSGACFKSCHPDRARRPFAVATESSVTVYFQVAGWNVQR